MWPWNKQGIASPNLNVTPQQQQYFSGTNTYQPGITGYNDMIQNPEGYPNALQNLERFQDNRFTGDDEVPGMSKKAIDYRDDPVNFMMRANHPTRFDPFVNAKNFAQELPGNIKDKVGSFKDTIGSWGKGIMDNTIVGKMAANFDATNPNAFNYNPRLREQIDFMKSPEAAKLGLSYGVMDQSGLNRITGGALAGKNLQSAFGSNDLTSMYEKELARAQGVLEGLPDQWSKLAASTDKDDIARWEAKQLFHRNKVAQIEKEQAAAAAAQQQAADERAQKEKNFVTQNLGVTAADAATSGRGFEHTRGQTSQQRGAAASRMGGGSRQAKSGSQVAGGSGRTDSGWGWKEGGRIGYQGGELVEQETDFIQGPQGGEEFQETVVEGQEQPSREQLEALAMHIFQLPLEELDDQQLVVVYQAAMQGQPMEEAVQEEDVQFAAQGGLAGLL